MAKDKNWKKLVTRQTAEVIECIHGIERVKAIFEKYKVGH